ncbi:MAG: portal protein, partial [Desulfobacteria bacterium]
MHIKELIQRFQDLQQARNLYESDFQDITDYVLPSGSDANTTVTPGTSRTTKIWDSTPMEALTVLAAGLNSNLTSPVERWFEIGIEGFSEEDMDRPTIQWLELVTDLIYSQFNRPSGGFYTAIGEAWNELGAYGTCILQTEWAPKQQGVKFQTFRLGNSYIAEDENQTIDTVYRQVEMTADQIKAQFEDLKGATIPDFVLKERNSIARHKIIHATQRRKNGKRGGISRNKPFSSHWFSVDEKVIIHESGFDSNPYAVSRWIRRSQEAYGFGPGLLCLQDIKMLQRMEQTIIRKAQKMVDPPLLIPNDGFMLPIQTGAAGVTFYDQFSGGEVKELYGNVRNELGIGLEMSEQRRQFIRNCFHNNLFTIGKERVEMKATEVIERRNENLRMLAPVIGRQSKELL